MIATIVTTGGSRASGGTCLIAGLALLVSRNYYYDCLCLGYLQLHYIMMNVRLYALISRPRHNLNQTPPAVNARDKENLNPKNRTSQSQSRVDMLQPFR